MTIAEEDIDTIVAVNKEDNVVSPCGMRRELISDYSPGARVIIPVLDESPIVVLVEDFLPYKFEKAWWL